MSEVVIRAEGLGKKFQVAHQGERARYVALRDVLADKLLAPLRWLRSRASNADSPSSAGVGPKIEGTLHSLGIFTFAQVASWKKAEREWVDAYLSFHGRIERDDWVKQAKALAKGGVAEYIRVFGKKPV